MSKLNISLSYKNACILKHALRNQIEFNEGMLRCIRRLLDSKDSSEEYKKALEESEYTEENYSKKLKEYEEEKRALKVMEEEMIKATECHGLSWYKTSSK